MNIIKIILYPSPLAPFFGKEEDLKLRCKLEWPKLHEPNTKVFVAPARLGAQWDITLALTKQARYGG